MAAPNKWTRERVAIRKPHIDRANALVTSGAFEGRGHEWADTTFPGLILRVGRQGGAWHLKTESRTVRLGDMSMSVSAAREAAKRSKAGKNPSRDNLRVWEDVTKSGVPVRTARAVAFPKTLHEPTEAERRRDGPWEWHDLVDVYLAKKLPTLKERWSRQYERHLRRAVDDHLRRKLVRDVTQEDLLKLRARILKARPASAAADTVEAIKAAMDWAKAQEPILSGLDSAAYPWWREGVQVEYQSGTRDHTPTLDELARTLVIAEHHRALGGTAKRTDDSTLAALWAIVLTAQRLSALVGTRRTTTRDWDERPGWRVWTWTAVEMKGPGGAGKKKAKPKPHGLPIPPAALAALARFGVDRSSTFLFPGRDPRRAVTASAMTGLFDRLKGKAKGAREGGLTVRPEGDLMERYGIRHWTPHDVRRTLSSLLDMERLGGSGSAILAHTKARANGDDGGERELPAAITLRHYIHSQRMDLKALGMDAWVAAVMEAYAREKAAFDARMPAAPVLPEPRAPRARARSRGRSAETNPLPPR
ncbi:hypothetical protein MBRA_01062 [Methylobacterium brachiatum]|nr:hypothetical protein MBRA_01062 [Methylobacterium brachiatum]